MRGLPLAPGDLVCTTGEPRTLPMSLKAQEGPALGALGAFGGGGTRSLSESLSGVKAQEGPSLGALGAFGRTAGGGEFTVSSSDSLFSE